MKKHFFAALFLGLAYVSFAQDLYIKPYVGYGVGYPGQTNYEVEGDTARTNYSKKNIQLGAGLRAGASFGILFDDGFGVDFDLAYQNNFGQDFTSNYTDIGFDPMTGMPALEENTFLNTFSAYSIRFTPSIHFELDRAEIKPFVDLGPTIMYSKLSTTMEQSTGFGASNIEEEYAGSLTLGATGNLGVEFEIADDIFLSTALRFTMGRTNPSSSEIVTYEVAGNDVLDMLDTADKEFVYEDEFIEGGDYDPDEPTTAPRQHIDYSSVSLIAGVKILLD